MRLLKSFVFPLILILLYFIADEFLGLEISLVCIFILGMVEYIYTHIREGRSNRTILWITLFFCIPTAIAIFTRGSAVEKLQPAIMEASVCILFGVLAFSKIGLMTAMPATFQKSIQLSEVQERTVKNIVKILFFILLIHNILTFIALSYFNEKIAIFIKGPLLYTLIVLFFATIIIRGRIISAKMKKEEWLPIVNEKGEITGKALRRICHSGSKLLHPVVHLHIVNTDHEIFLQKRSAKKDLLPGMWDTAVGGHIGLNEKVEDALKRETFEELGITRFDAKLLGTYIWESDREKELVFSFLCIHYDHIQINNDEVDEGRFWSGKEINANLNNNNFTPNFIHEYNKYLT